MRLFLFHPSAYSSIIFVPVSFTYTGTGISFRESPGTKNTLILKGFLPYNLMM